MATEIEAGTTESVVFPRSDVGIVLGSLPDRLWKAFAVGESPMGTPLDYGFWSSIGDSPGENGLFNLDRTAFETNSTTWFATVNVSALEGTPNGTYDIYLLNGPYNNNSVTTYYLTKGEVTVVGEIVIPDPELDVPVLTLAKCCGNQEFLEWAPYDNENTDTIEIFKDGVLHDTISQAVITWSGDEPDFDATHTFKIRAVGDGVQTEFSNELVMQPCPLKGWRRRCSVSTTWSRSVQQPVPAASACSRKVVTRMLPTTIEEDCE